MSDQKQEEEPPSKKTKNRTDVPPPSLLEVGVRDGELSVVKDMESPENTSGDPPSPPKINGDVGVVKNKQMEVEHKKEAIPPIKIPSDSKDFTAVSKVTPPKEFSSSCASLAGIKLVDKSISMKAAPVPEVASNNGNSEVLKEREKLPSTEAQEEIPPSPEIHGGDAVEDVKVIVVDKPQSTVAELKEIEETPLKKNMEVGSPAKVNSGDEDLLVPPAPPKQNSSEAEEIKEDVSPIVEIPSGDNISGELKLLKKTKKEPPTPVTIPSTEEDLQVLKKRGRPPSKKTRREAPTPVETLSTVSVGDSAPVKNEDDEPPLKKAKGGGGVGDSDFGVVQKPPGKKNTKRKTSSKGELLKKILFRKATRQVSSPVELRLEDGDSDRVKKVEGKRSLKKHKTEVPLLVKIQSGDGDSAKIKEVKKPPLKGPKNNLVSPVAIPPGSGGDGGSEVSKKVGRPPAKKTMEIEEEVPPSLEIPCAEGRSASASRKSREGAASIVKKRGRPPSSKSKEEATPPAQAPSGYVVGSFGVVMVTPATKIAKKGQDKAPIVPDIPSTDRDLEVEVEEVKTVKRKRRSPPKRKKKPPARKTKEMEGAESAETMLEETTDMNEAPSLSDNPHPSVCRDGNADGVVLTKRGRRRKDTEAGNPLKKKAKKEDHLSMEISSNDDNLEVVKKAGRSTSSSKKFKKEATSLGKCLSDDEDLEETSNPICQGKQLANHNLDRRRSPRFLGCTPKIYFPPDTIPPSPTETEVEVPEPESPPEPEEKIPPLRKTRISPPKKAPLHLKAYPSKKIPPPKDASVLDSEPPSESETVSPPSKVKVYPAKKVPPTREKITPPTKTVSAPNKVKVPPPPTTKKIVYSPKPKPVTPVTPAVEINSSKVSNCSSDIKLIYPPVKVPPQVIPPENSDLGPLSGFKKEHQYLPDHLVQNMSKQTIFVYGPPGVGKTSWVKAMFPEFLFVTDIKAIGEFRPEVHKGIILDGMTEKTLDYEDITGFLMVERPCKISVPGGKLKLPKGLPRVVTTTLTPGELFKFAATKSSLKNYGNTIIHHVLLHWFTEKIYNDPAELKAKHANAK